MRCGRLGVVAVFALLAGWKTAAPAASSSSFRAEVVPLAIRPRSDAPSLVDVKLKWNGSGLLEGRVELSISTPGGEPLFMQTGQEIAMPRGEQTVRFLLPPLPGLESIAAVVRVRRKADIVDGGRTMLGVDRFSHSFLMAVSSAGPTLVRQTRYWQEARLDRFNQRKTYLSDWATTPAFFEVADLPESALAWCAFDVAVLEGEAFRSLRRKQLAALVQWVEGGGSLFVVPEGRFTDDHLRELNRLAGRAEPGAGFQLDAERRVARPRDPVVMSRPELGRCVVAFDATHANWAEVATFLWKVRPAIAAELREGKPLVWPMEEHRLLPMAAVYSALEPRMPQTMRMVPPSVVAAILVGFVICVGPGEWFALGWLRCRKWTWITFPLTALTFTALTMWAAEHYLGSKDHQSAITISDVGSGGRILRETKMLMLLSGRTREWSTDVTQSFIVPTSFLQDRPWGGREARAKKTVVYEGQHPGRYRFRQTLAQWTPQVDRLLTFECGPDTSGILWENVTGQDLAHADHPAQFFSEKAKCGAAKVHIICNGAVLGAHPSDPIQYLASMSMRTPKDRRSIMSTLSPTGSHDLEDLAIHEPGDSHEWLVVAIVDDQKGSRILRRIYREP